MTYAVPWISPGAFCLFHQIPVSKFHCIYFSPLLCLISSLLLGCVCVDFIILNCVLCVLNRFYGRFIFDT